MVRPVLDYLASKDPSPDGQYQNWHITRITGGWNNLLYRATNSLSDLAIKFTVRDRRHRADREYSALSALHQAGLSIAPKPVLLDRTRYAQPVVVQTWLEGKVSATPPTTDDEWMALLQHLAAIHTLTPDKTDVRLRKAVLNANNVKEGRKIVRQQMTLIPQEAQPASLQALLRQFEATRFPDWPEAPVALCRVDANTLNFVRRPGLWASVDWENSGWGDPAFEIADLMTHAAYVEVPSRRWEWAIDAYCNLTSDIGAAIRIQVYYKVLLVWWVARLARYLYQVPRGLDERLVSLPVDWQADMLAKYEHYWGLAEACLA